MARKLGALYFLGAVLLLSGILVYKNTREDDSKIGFSNHKADTAPIRSRLTDVKRQLPSDGEKSGHAKGHSDGVAQQNDYLLWAKKMVAGESLNKDVEAAIDTLAKKLLFDMPLRDVFKLLSTNPSANSAANSMLLGSICRHYAARGSDDFFRVLNSMPEDLLVRIGTFEAPAEELAKHADLFEVMGKASAAPASIRQLLRVGLIRGWTKTDPDTVGNWLNLNKAYPNHDRLIVVFCEEINSVDPEAALKWAETITNPGLKKDALDSLKRRKPEAPQTP